MKKIIVILVLIAIGYVIYKYYAKPKMLSSSMTSGDIVSNDLMSPDQKARFLKENSGEDADGQSEHKSTRGNQSADGPSAATSAMPATTPTAPADSMTSATPAATPAKSTDPVFPAASSTAAAPVSYPAPAAAPASTSMATSISTALGAPPKGDSIPANPPNDMRFTGSGTFQWYRQGNITWRVDTVTGRSCIVFATDEEWRKPRVLSHGCGRNA